MKTSTIQSEVREITYHPSRRREIFLSLARDRQRAVFSRLSSYVQTQLILNLDDESVLPILEHLAPDYTTDLLQRLPKKRQNSLLNSLSEELQNKVAMLLEFDPKTAAGLMSLNYIQIEKLQHLHETASHIQTHEKRTGKLPVILVTEEGKLTGFLPIQELIYSKPGDRAEKSVKKIVTIKHTAKHETVVNTFLENPHSKVVVLDDNENILGVIYSDDVLKTLRENEASTLYDFAGVREEETIFVSAKQKVKYRYKWLMINLATAFLASFMVSLFDETISKYVLLAVYMPIVAGMGGNAATQTLAILVRGIALKQIELKTALPTLKKELLAALANGLINGVLVAAIVLIFNRDIKIAIILALAMIINLVVAGFFGTVVPLIMNKLGKDPATSATIFITTATDVLGFLAFLGIATLILN